jgi:hypothetical protein
MCDPAHAFCIVSRDAEFVLALIAGLYCVAQLYESHRRHSGRWSWDTHVRRRFVAEVQEQAIF